MIDFKNATKKIRLDIVTGIHKAKKGHLGGALSCVDVLYYLYKEGIVDVFEGKNTNNTFVLSKGHASFALLAVVNFIKQNKYKDLVDSFNLDGSLSGNNCSELVPGFEFHTGSLGHGLGLGSGVALSKKLNNINGETIVLIGDGELHEGSTLEALLFAQQHDINVTLVIDNNRQICEDFIDKVVSVSKIINFLETNFDCLTIDGHKYNDIIKIKPFISQSGFKIVICNTIKGKGISFMESNIRWHHSIPNDKEYNLAKEELS